MVQKHFRAYKQRKAFAQRKAITLVQGVLRQKERARIYQKHKAMALIHGACKSRLEQRKFANAWATLRIQELWRAKQVRRHVRELSAAELLKKNMRAYSRRKWLKSMQATYADAKRENQWGRGFRAKWPNPAPSWLDVKAFQRMEETWRYKLLLGSIKNREPVYREKVAAYNVFHDHKPWEPAAIWGDHSYLACALNPTADAFKAAFSTIPSGDKKCYFSDLVDKMNPDGKMVERAVMITEKGFYRMTPGKVNIVVVVVAPRSSHQTSFLSVCS